MHQQPIAGADPWKKTAPFYLPTAHPAHGVSRDTMAEVTGNLARPAGETWPRSYLVATMHPRGAQQQRENCRKMWPDDSGRAASSYSQAVLTCADRARDSIAPLRDLP